MADWAGQVAVVTGGASGIGRALGARLARAGARVVLADIDADGVRDTAQALDGDVVGLHVDVLDEASVFALAAEVRARFDKVHLLFNNAGVGVREARRDMWDLPERDWAWAYGVNVMGVVHGIRAFVPGMIAHGEPGHVVNTSSTNGGIAPLPTTPIYASSKAAVTSLTEVLHHQLVRAGAAIRAHLLFPGPHLVDTNILNADRSRPEGYQQPGAAPPPYLDMAELAKAAGIGAALTDPDEVAALALSGMAAGHFWILPEGGSADDKARAHLASILARRLES